ncbi:MAG TPA: flagellar basal body rod C-terminal domain-containing protein, partial [Myxococcota bacterium]
GLNREIMQSSASGGPPNDLLDQRQVALDALSSQLGATVVPGSGTAVTVTLPGGQTLVSGENAATIDVATGSDGRLMLRVGGADGTPGRLVDNKQVGGAVGGLFQARDVDLQSALDQLDTFAFDFATAMNTAHQSGIALDGSSGRDLFAVGATSSGAARSLAVSAAVAENPALLGISSTGAPGDAGALQNLLATRDAALSGGSDVFATLGQMTASFGEKARSASVDQASATSLLAHGVSLREGVSGVSIDEELVSIQQAERAFQASSKVISTADSMLQTILDLK